MMRRLLLAALLVLPCPLTLHAADQTVLGNQFLVNDGGTKTGSLLKRKITVTAKESATDNTIVGNPVASGATVTITASGGTPSSQTFTLPVGTSGITGKPFWSGDAIKGFKYKASKGENGPLTGAQIKRSGTGVFTMKITVNSKFGAVNVIPPNDGTAGCALLGLTGGDTYSVAFSTGLITNKTVKQFKVKKPTAQGSCVPTTTTTSTSTTSTTTSSTTSTTAPPNCGNHVIDPGETCETPGSACGAFATCSWDCTCPCDFLDESDCLYPFPSDYLTTPDGSTDTGIRVHFNNAGMPKNIANVPIESSDYNRNDGFSPGASILVHVPNVDLTETGAVPITDIARSLDSDAPIVIVNTATLAHHPFWAELDANATSEPSRALILRPAVSLTEGTRYIVALRNMKDATDAVIPAGAAFAAYRDNTPTGDPVKEARRAHMEDIFTTLAAAGVARNDLYLAWDFTVASERNLTERLLFMRDDAFARLGSAAPAFVVSNVFEHGCTTQNNPPFDGACSVNADCGPGGVCNTASSGVDADIFRRVFGTYQVERYVNSTGTGARFALDPNGLPTHQATTQPASFICNIPRAALASAGANAVPARASIYGHGLLGSNDEVDGGNVEDMANEHDFVFCATKWIGMADEDVGTAGSILLELGKFPALTDRLQQAMVNQLFLARLMINPHGFVSDPAFKDSFGVPVIDTSDVFYDGNSQGGIFGGTVMSIAQDITRGVLGVPGINYSLLLTRSTDFATYSQLLYPSYPNQLQRPLGLALIQMLWDRSDPNGYAAHMTTDPLPNTPPHKVLMHVAFGDHQVSTVSAELEARTIGAFIHAPAINPGRNPDVTPYYGIPAIPSYPFDGSAIVIWDSGANTPPITNTAPATGFDPHSDPRKSVIARNQKSAFLTTGGNVIDVCSGVACVIPHP